LQNCCTAATNRLSPSASERQRPRRIMEFSILGPLEVRRDGRPIALGGRKQRAVLAVLLLHSNEPVSASRLAMAVWGEEAPRSAIRTVHAYVSRLRKLLRDDHGRLVAGPAGIASGSKGTSSIWSASSG
jgi:DNA-binding SARP family transcriptional activator